MRKTGIPAPGVQRVNIALAHGNVVLLELLDVSATFDMVELVETTGDLLSNDVCTSSMVELIFSRPSTNNCHQPIQVVSSQTQLRCATRINIGSDTFRPLRQRRQCNY